MGAGGTWRVVFHKRVLIALTGVEAEISASNSDERELGIAARETVVDEISDRTSEMTCDRQKSDPEFLLIGCGRVFGIEQMQIQPCDRDRDQNFPHRHKCSRSIRLPRASSTILSRMRSTSTPYLGVDRPRKRGADPSTEWRRQQQHHFLSHIGVSQIEAHSADVDDCEIEREIFFAKKSRVRLAGGF